MGASRFSFFFPPLFPSLSLSPLFFLSRSRCSPAAAAVVAHTSSCFQSCSLSLSLPLESDGLCAPAATLRPYLYIYRYMCVCVRERAAALRLRPFRVFVSFFSLSLSFPLCCCCCCSSCVYRYNIYRYICTRAAHRLHSAQRLRSLTSLSPPLSRSLSPSMLKRCAAR